MGPKIAFSQENMSNIEMVQVSPSWFGSTNLSGNNTELKTEVCYQQIEKCEICSEKYFKTSESKKTRKKFSTLNKIRD